MTEVLTQEEITGLNRDADCNHDFSSEQMQKALNTIEAKDKEIEALKGQVAALFSAGDNVLKKMFHAYKAKNGRECYIQADDGEACVIVHSDDILLLQNSVENTQQTAQAFETSNRKDEREKTIRECISKSFQADYSYYSEPDQEDAEENGFILTVKDLEALLTKEQA